ncbi:hypothetical protein DH2020_037584 [Rehmannia glutinosa]|uniref:LOB domain-containing protein n=1 Tax=Rehmannia glutinosa TaxID=99300 RepID=A0ABR0V165_REHGL
MEDVEEGRKKMEKDKTECVFAPYFPPENPQKFANVHKVFGASNVGKLLNELNPNQRIDAVNSLAYEAACRIKDPIYGCVGHVAYMQHHLRQIHEQTELAKKELATYIGPSAVLPILNPNHPAVLQQQQNFDPTAQQAAMYHALQMGGPPGGQLVQQHQQQQIMAAATDQEMLRAQQQQQEQLYVQQLHQQQQILYAQQQQQHQQELYVQQKQQQVQQQQQQAQQKQQHVQQKQQHVQQQQQLIDLTRSNDEFEDAGNPATAVTATGFIQMPTANMGGSSDTLAYQLIQQQHARAQEHLLQQQQSVTADHHHRHLQLAQHELDQRQASHSQQQTLRDSSEDDMPCVINTRPSTNTFSE